MDQEQILPGSLASGRGFRDGELRTLADPGVIETLPIIPAADDAGTFINVVSKLDLRARHGYMIAISAGAVNPAAGSARSIPHP